MARPTTMPHFHIFIIPHQYQFPVFSAARTAFSGDATAVVLPAAVPAAAPYATCICTEAPSAPGLATYQY